MQLRARVRQIPCDMFLLPKRWEKKCNFPMIAGEMQLTKVTMKPVSCTAIEQGVGAEMRVNEELPARALSDTGTASMQRGRSRNDD